MTCGQLTLSQLIRLLFPARLLFFFFFLPLPLALISLFVSNPWAGRGRFVPTLFISFVFCFFHISVCAFPVSSPSPPPSPSVICSLTAPSTGQFSFLLHLCIRKRLKEWGHFTITLYHPCCSLSKSGEKQSLPSPRELALEENSCPHWLQRRVCDPCRCGNKFSHGNTTGPDMFAPET